MAIYHCSATIIGRSNGRSSVAASAYRCGERLTNERDGVTHDYRNKSGVVFSEVFTPEHAPEWAKNRELLWNSVEAFEKQHNAQTAREINVALPAEFDREQQQEVLREYVRTFTDNGMIVDCAIHDKKDGNPHAHIMLTMREIEEQGNWQSKARKEYLLNQSGERIKTKSGEWKSVKVNRNNWNDKETLQEWREKWQDIANRHLERAGRDERIDCRTLDAQGIDRQPTIHIGHEAAGMEKKGIKTERGDINRRIRADNLRRDEVKKEVRELENELRQEVERERKAQPAHAPATGQRADHAAPMEKTAEEKTDDELCREVDLIAKPHLEAARKQLENEIRKAHKEKPEYKQYIERLKTWKEACDKYDSQWSLFKSAKKNEKLIAEQQTLDAEDKRLNSQLDERLRNMKPDERAKEIMKTRDPAGYRKCYENAAEWQRRQEERQREETRERQRQAAERAAKDAERQKQRQQNKSKGWER